MTENNGWVSMAQFKITSRLFSGEAEEEHGNLQS
jgi:hypothetical protein